jgi:signal transduction histidine kinase
MTTQEALNGHDLATAMPLLANGKPMAAGEHPVTECLIKKQPVRSRVSQRTALVRAQGDALPITITASPLLAGDQTNGAVIVFEDVTEERQIDAMKTEFIALAGHQLRTPVGALRWHIELLREGAEGLTEEQRSSLTEMQTLVERTVHLLNTLLQSAKLDEGAIEPSWTDVNLTPMLRDLVQSVSELAARSKAEVTLDLPENLTITTDQTLLSIVIYNIITNAVKYAKPGQGLVLLSAKDTGDSVVISVRDNGIGIPDEAKARLFEKFFRAKNAQVIDTDGNGLGLYISQSILSRLQGSIAFSSILDRGTSFTVTLPKHRANASGK